MTCNNFKSFEFLTEELIIHEESSSVYSIAVNSNILALGLENKTLIL
jgi:hypothetical protein